MAIKNTGPRLLAAGFALLLLSVASPTHGEPPDKQTPEPKVAAKAGQGSTPVARKPLPWRTSLAEGKIQAQRGRQALLVRFGTESCPWCRTPRGSIATS